MNFSNADGHDRRDEPFQLTAMVDVVFILLSFFVMATQLRLPELDLPVSHRKTSLSRGAKIEDFPSSVVLTLQRAPSGQVAIRLGRAVLPDSGFDEIRARLAEINLPQIPVLVQADAVLTVDEVARALDAVLSSPMNKVSIGGLTATAAAGGPQR